MVTNILDEMIHVSAYGSTRKESEEIEKFEKSLTKEELYKHSEKEIIKLINKDGTVYDSLPLHPDYDFDNFSKFCKDNYFKLTKKEMKRYKHYKEI